jgi:hypothetical protein
MSALDDFPQRPDDQLPIITRLTPEEAAKIFCETSCDNQNSRSEETEPPWFSGPCTYITRREAAEYLRISPKSLENHPENIPYYKLGKRVLYIKEELDEIIRNNKHGGESCQRLQ